MTALQNVREARIALKARGTSDAKHAEQIEDMFAEAQKIISEMNVAKLDAMREAEKPYLEKLEALDKEMAFLISIMG